MNSLRPLRALLAVCEAEGLVLEENGSLLLAFRSGHTQRVTLPPSSEQMLAEFLRDIPDDAPRFEVWVGEHRVLAVSPPPDANAPDPVALPGLGTQRLRVSMGRWEIVLLEGNIAEQDTDAVVNAAHPDLRGGQGVDAAIHLRGGPVVLQQCREIGGCAEGEAVITTGGQMRARFVIHAVGPEYDPYCDKSSVLASAYRESLRLAERHGLSSIAFPAISTGAFCFPMAVAAPVALRTVYQFLKSEAKHLRHVRFVLYPRETRAAFAVHRDALQALLHPPRGGRL